MTRTPWTSMWSALAVVALLLAAGCGGDDDADGGADQPGEGGTETGDEEPGTDAAATGPAGAVVIIDGERYEANQELVCISLGGALSAQFQSGDGVTIGVDLPPEDWETSTTGDWDAPSLRVDDERDENMMRQYESGPDLGAGADEPAYAGVVVDSFRVDGRTASGSATVVDVFGVLLARGSGGPLPDPLPATFELTCG